MDYENYPCPACGSHLHDGDDVVVCPVCGTPQHRSCWVENGKCANDALHASGYKWSRESSGGSREEQPETRAENADIRLCHVCGSENPADFAHCGRCGALLMPNSDEPVTTKCIYCGSENPAENSHCKNCGAPLTPYVRPRENPYVAAAGINENEIIGKHTAGEIATFVRSSVRKYLEKFKRIESGQKVSFNWAAFFFGYVWLFARKLYKQGLVIILLVSTVYLAASSTPGFQKAAELMYPYVESGATEIPAEELQAVYSQMWELAKTPFLIAAAAILIIRIFCGFAGDRFYYNKTQRELDNAVKQTPDKNLQAMLVYRRGGLSFLSAFSGVLTYYIISSILFSVAQAIADKI